jgi:diguanylate cyclase (GGDEF)-like protein
VETERVERFLGGNLSEPGMGILVEALNFMDVGILLLDANLRVRFFNRRQAELFGLPAALLASGPTFRDLLDYAAAHSTFAVPASELPEYLNQREVAIRAGAVAPAHINLSDGIRVLFSCKVCSDGGRILTYIDVSDEVRPEALNAAEQINAELRFSNEILENQATGLVSLAEDTNENVLRIEAARMQLEYEITERRNLEERLRQMATTDGLTGTLNRTGFLAAAQRELEREQRPGRALTLLMIDVDHFKSINDRCGHAGGDQALRHLVSVLRGGLRQSDLLGRLGGEEFAVVLSNVTPEDAERVTERLLHSVARSPTTHEEHAINMTISIGLTIARQTDSSIEQIIARADNALYRAKARGRNRIEKANDGVLV